ncbi:MULTISPECIES: hypothetical protein [Sorangium]|uniref:Uncharacterized protein n=1 Tax=Sorangium cellulosum TaxID=56 RepID=A0A4P2QWJ5_SORCE|nr:MULTISPECIES: hypothetical protein [Sorangium]AUX34531.1 hypothetical protein SOCE836_067050 [Sorangium cellulosum]WCQ93845.1 hypothetical protein NQZ70_06601 [Sorangium sp. Soce836]
MSWKESCRTRLREHLDARGDLAPPWARFPDYERHTLGWRMGAGEDWMGMWSVFLEQLAPDPETRIAYLRRHPPAPVSWADVVHEVLFPAERSDDDSDEDDSDEGDSDEDDPTAAAQRRSALLEQGLIASDVAFATWLGQQTGVSWPWARCPAPEDAARYNTRELWFWSRQVAELRRGSEWTPPGVPESWRACAQALETGDVGTIEPRRGLLSLARLLCAGQVQAPWQLGLSLADFADSFDDDMGYVDAFRLWGMSAFDDALQLRRYLEATRMPPGWRDWVAEQFPVA